MLRPRQLLPGSARPAPATAAPRTTRRWWPGPLLPAPDALRLQRPANCSAAVNNSARVLATSRSVVGMVIVAIPCVASFDRSRSFTKPWVRAWRRISLNAYLKRSPPTACGIARVSSEVRAPLQRFLVRYPNFLLGHLTLAESTASEGKPPKRERRWLKSCGSIPNSRWRFTSRECPSKIQRC
jgi:hypothetical protein